MDHSWGYATDPRLREENQDCHGVFEFPDFTLAVVCDGMGGHVGGAHASAIAVRTIHDTLGEIDCSDLPAALEEALGRANQAIYEAARKNHRLMGMGTTVVAAAITDDHAYLAHVGDSRAYLVRGNDVKQITRDHTMVNLFVDAELLTPEDAATHPEAHVLSRSLGVERTVDVEISEPVQLKPDDVIFLCSDGVHGVVTEWELANVDWGAPGEGVAQVLEVVAAREGDDNATAVAVLLATSFEDVPPTPVPQPEKLGDGSADYGKGIAAAPMDDASGRTIVPDGLADEDHIAPASLSAPESLAGVRPSIRPQAPPPPEPEPEPAPIVPDVRKRAKATEEAKQASGNRTRVLLLAAVGVLGVGGLGLVGAVFAAMSLGGGEAEVAPLELEPDATAMVQVEPAHPEVEPVPDEPIPPGELPLFQPTLPEAPRRLPHRPLEYTQPPPGGPAQWEAVQSARNKNCADSLAAVIRGMHGSIDHATLYSQAWFCYNEVHQRPLADAKVVEPADFAHLVVHFEGPPEKRGEQPEEIKRLPTWFQPALDGIEHRLEAWSRSDEHDRFSIVMIDLVGEPTAADHLTRDLLLEATAAAGFARLEKPDERAVAWWARRVYVTAYHLNGPVGRLIAAHRPEVIPEIRAMLEASVADKPADPTDPKAKPTPVPVMVKDAYETGIGIKDKPDPTKPRAATGPVKPIEPDLDDLDLGPATIHRQGELVTESPL